MRLEPDISLVNGGRPEDPRRAEAHISEGHRAVAWLRRPEVALFALVLGAYAYFYQGGGWNQNSRFDLTRAIVEQRTSIIDRYASNTGDLSCRGPQGRCEKASGSLEHYYCDKAPGLSWLAVPAYALIYAAFGTEGPGDRYFAVSGWWVTVAAVAVPSALAVVALYLGLEAFNLTRRVRIGLATAYGLGTLAFPYSTLFYGHQLAAALLLIAFVLLIRIKHSNATPSAGLLVGVGLLLGYAVVVEYPAALAVAPLIVYAALCVRPLSRLAWVVSGLVLASIALASYHWSLFGSPFTTPYAFSTQTYRNIGFMGIGRPSFTVFRTILFSRYRGLFYSSPWLLLAVPGAIMLLIRRGRRAEACLCIAIAALFIWLNSSLIDWEGGWTMGPRYLVPSLPFLAILAAGILPERSSERGVNGRTMVAFGLATVLILASFLIMLVGTAVGPEIPKSIPRPFTSYLLPSFLAGKLSVNSQGIEDLWPQGMGVRRAWNMGQVVGLNGLASLLPLGVYFAGVGAWLTWTLSRDDAD